ncbi:substrate-binding periplasmic protein [Pseudomonas sp. FEN]|uniref:substrate-binding periplasmic protein n=1 Tax=Pseudomonas sp. FEN TaxID=2767468 RepID=UPI00174B8515|nr:transporter substrate-binding domain-containing protein [Pseudomonas sp. FEN]CAD5197901.1 ABC-type amino acid transport/signal transduction system, periplasmic component/domain [Pseudomonas sp. FEN]
MDRLRATALSLLLGLPVLAPEALALGKCERLIVTGSPDAPPYLWRDPQDPAHLIGASADLLRQVAVELGLKVEVLYGGRRSEAQAEVRSGRMDLLLDAPLALDELDSLDYIHPALLQNDFLVWTRKDSPLVYNSVEDLHGHAGAVSEKARMTQSFSAFSQERLSLRRTPSLTPALHKLLLGEVEYVLAGRYAGMVTTQALGMANDIEAHPQPVDQPGLFLAVSHNSACNDPWLRGQLAKKMTELPASGLTEAALQRNLERWKAQLQPVGAPKP